MAIDIDKIIEIAQIIDPAFTSGDAIRRAYQILELTEQKQAQAPERKQSNPPLPEESLPPEEPSSTIDRLRAYIKRKKIGIQEVALALGVSYSSVHFWLAGNSGPRAKNRTKIEAYIRRNE